MSLYVNGVLQAGINDIPSYTRAEYEALTEKPEYWICTDMEYSDLPSEYVTYGSGTVKDALDDLSSINLGSFADLTSLETAIKNKLATMKKGDILTGVFSTTQSFAPFNITGGQSIIIQSRGDNNSTIGMIQVWNQLGYMHYGFCSNGTFTWKKPTLT